MWALQKYWDGYQKTHSRMFIAALFKITKYYFNSYPNAKKKSRKEIMYSNDKDELQLHRIVCLNLTNIMLSERSQIYLYYSNFMMFRNKKTYLVVKVMVTVILLMGCNWLERGTMKASGMLVMIRFLMWVLVAQVGSPNILNFHLDLYMFLHVCYISIKRKCERWNM